MIHKLIEAFEDPDGGTSMTRIIAGMFAAVLCYAIILMARRDHLHDAGWPLCVMVCVVVLAVPLQALFRALTEWFKSKPGKDLIQRLIDKAVPGGTTVVSADTVNVGGETA